MSEPTWRIGDHYGIHVYEADPTQPDDRPVATFHRKEDAARAVLAVNRGQVPDDEFVLLPPRGWLNRIDEVLREQMPDGMPSLEEVRRFRATSEALGDLVRGWAVGLDNGR